MELYNQGNSNTPPPFLTKTYEMVDDPRTNSIVSWSQSGLSFIVLDPPEFSKDLLPMYFKHSNFSSFVRQLNTYGFRKIDPDQWEFANEEFIRGHTHLLTNIQRRKPVHSHSIQNQASSAVSISEAERKELEEEIFRLKHENSLLQMELQRDIKDNHEYEFQIQLVSERLQNIEHRQMQLISFLAQLVQKPGLASILKQQSEIHNKRRRLPAHDHKYNQSDMEEIACSALQRIKQHTGSAPLHTIEIYDKLNSSLKFWEKYLFEISESLGDNVYESAVSFQQSPVVITELCTHSKDNAHKSCSPRIHPSSSSPNLTEICPSQDMENLMDRVESPPISSDYQNIEIRPNATCITSDSLKEVGEGKAGPLPTGANDNFWQQFLTEAPGSGRVLLNTNSVDSPDERMEHSS